MERYILTLILLLAGIESVRAQYQPWAVQWLQHASNPLTGRQYLGVTNLWPGANITFSPVGNGDFYINSSGGGGGGNLQLFGDVTSALTALPNVTTTLKNTGTAGTYVKTTFDAQGRETSGLTQINLATDVSGLLPNANLQNSSVTYNGETASLGGSATLTLASSDFANQGSVHTLLHGNASGNPSWSAVNLATDVTGTLPGSSVSGVWLTAGNALSGGTGILGTTDASPWQFYLNNVVYGQMEPTHDSIQLGPGNTTTGTGSIAIGTNNSITSIYAISIGNGYNNGAGSWISGNQISGLSSISIGSANIVSANDAVSIGIGQNLSGDFSTAIGFAASTSGSNSFACGLSAGANGAYSVAVGKNATANNMASMVFRDAIPVSVSFPNSSDTASNQFIVNMRGGMTLYSGRNGLTISEKNGIPAATVMSLTNGVIYAERGFASHSRNLLAPQTISVGASPFNWTNEVATAGTNVFVFIDGSGVTGSVALNGTTIFSALAGADATVPLQPGEYVTVTYTIGTPTMTWKPW